MKRDKSMDYKSLLNNIKAKISKDKTNNLKDKLKKFHFDFNIKAQLLLGFTVPVIFVVLVGTISYNKAKDGMISNYEVSAQNTIDTQMNYLDFGLALVRGDISQLKLDLEIQSLVGGTYKNDNAKAASVTNKTNSNIVIKKTLNSFINNIYIIPKSDQKVISTTKKEVGRETNNEMGYFETWADTEEGKAISSSQITGWISEHAEMDKLTGYNSDEYLLSFMTVFPNKGAVITVDINKEKIRENLQSIDVSDGAIVGFITAEGKEVVVKEENNNIDIVFFEQDFYQNSLTDEDKGGSEYIKYKGKDYLYIYRTSEETGATLAYLVPQSKVIASAAEIRGLTILLVAISVVVAAVLGLVISFNITYNMDSIIKRIKKVAEGDLTVQMKTKGHSEFTTLNKHIAHMIDNTRNLIVGVENIVNNVGDSAIKLETVSNEMSESSTNITGALIEIDSGVGQQAEDAQDCLTQMDRLSDIIESVVTDIGNTARNSENNKQIVVESITTMDTLSKQTADTIEITSKVKDNVKELETKAKEISKFVGIISEIASQTNLLSLNASIEAARAGEAGRGFSVVAEEIRKLADGSNQAADEIDKLVAVISKQAKGTVETTIKAEEIVKEQSNTVDDIKEVFENIAHATDNIINNIKEVEDKVKGMDSERVATLESISSISAVSEETSALSSNLSAVAQGQQEVVESLIRTSGELKNNTEELKEAISVFKTTDDLNDERQV